jgi:hypothetical protein
MLAGWTPDRSTIPKKYLEDALVELGIAMPDVDAIIHQKMISILNAVVREGLHIDHVLEEIERQIGSIPDVPQNPFFLFCCLCGDFLWVKKSKHKRYARYYEQMAIEETKRLLNVYQSAQ